MNWGTMLVLLILLAIVGLIIRSMIKARKSGRSIQCGCDCGHCGGICHQAVSAEKLVREQQYEAADRGQYN